MKTTFSSRHAFGAAIMALGLAGGLAGQTAKAQDQPLPTPADNVTPASPTALPANIYPSSPLAQVIKLMQAGVSEDVIKNYVVNSGSTFNLDSDKIIYLKDIGLPDDIVTAMMQRDQALQQQMAATTYQPQPPETAPAVETDVSAEAAPPPPTEDVTVDYFHSSLAPYGTWVDVDGYGLCWQPTVLVLNPGWSPYCDGGHWIYTDDGWYWYSTYSWGWAPFHYGRWFRDARLGWCWCPDTVWGPSWVTWRYSDDYCGWAPLPPGAIYREGVGFFYNGASVSVGFDFGLGVNAFTFVPTRDFCDPHPRSYRVAPGEVAVIFNRTTVVNNFNMDRDHRVFINHGIDPGRITAVTHTEIHPVAIREATTRIARGQQLGSDGRTLIVDRPRFTAMPNTGVRGNPTPNMRGAAPPAPPRPQPGIGSPYRVVNDAASGNNYSEPRRDNQPATPMPPVSPRAPAMPPAPVEPRSPAAPVAPAPRENFNRSADNRWYPSPRMQQMEQQSPRANPGNPVERTAPPAPAPTPAASAPPNIRQPSTPPAAPSRSQDSGRGRDRNGR